MNFGDIDWKKGILAGLVAGICWGWLALAVNTVAGAFLPDRGFFFNLAMFATGGAVYGIVVGGLLAALRDIIPFKSLLAKAVLISVCLWLALRTGGAVLSGVAPWRYHQVMVQTVQGFFLAVLMGLILGVLWKRSFNSSSDR